MTDAQKLNWFRLIQIIHLHKEYDVSSVGKIRPMKPAEVKRVKERIEKRNNPKV